MSDKRVYQLQKVAHQLGMNFQSEDIWNLHALLEDFSLFNKGRRRTIYNMLHRSDDFLQTQIYIFDYRYRKGKGRAGDRRQTVFFVHSKFLGLPHLAMKPETILHKIGELMGFEDIDFEEYPVFSKQYRLKGDDESFIRASINDQVLHFFSEEKNWYLEGVNYYLVFYRKAVLMPPAEIRRFYRKGMGVFHMLSRRNKESVFE